MNPELALVCGMASEARSLPAGVPGVIIGAGNAAALSAKLEGAIANGAKRVLSFGVCGGLNGKLPAGAVIIGVRATYKLAAVSCDPDWCDRLLEALMTPALPFPVAFGSFAWSATAVARLADKAALRAATMADVVDEETFLALSIAAAHGLPGAAVRVVCDPESFELPPAARLQLTAAGFDDMGAILDSVVGDFGQIGALWELDGYSITAMSSLRAVLRRVGTGFAA